LITFEQRGLRILSESSTEDLKVTIHNIISIRMERHYHGQEGAYNSPLLALLLLPSLARAWKYLGTGERLLRLSRFLSLTKPVRGQ